jgi:two-component system, OmpR family, sensor histidine kinase TctE
LLDNAIRYTPNGGRVTLSLKELENTIELRVEDNGIGIPEAERDMVFERFHRVIDNSQEGSGLGLSIVKEVIALHGASINIESAVNASGTVIVVRLRKKV